MRFTDPANLDWVDGVRHRATAINLKVLLEGHGFQLTLSEVHDTAMRSPRHRHNFDQIRIGLAGVATYGRSREIRERMIGYFPEGTRYGPQGVTAVPNFQVVLQFEGASASRYLATDVINRSTDTLRRAGQFRDGFYFAEGELRGVDAFQAVWEHASGQPMVYPVPRYEDPVYLHLDSFSYHPSGDPGVDRKLLAAFSERELSLRMTRLAPDAQVQVGDRRQRCITFVLDGPIRLGGDRLGQWSAVYTDPGEHATVSGAGQQAELVEIALPVIEAAEVTGRQEAQVAV
ncbi:MAG: hypothetical protein ACRDXC_08180 [Acidimicrobiales bacterium]